jgi:predicted HicB family RNase H-like nuclease
MSRRVSIRIPDELYAKLVERAAQERRTLSNLITALMSEATEPKKPSS